MTLNITRLKPEHDVSAELADVLERVVHETLADILTDDVSVRFGTWRSETGATQLVCKVEAAGDPFLPGWRWWSRLCDSAEDLRDALAEVALKHGIARGLPAPTVAREESARARLATPPV
jgi:hypothetical protein